MQGGDTFAPSIEMMRTTPLLLLALMTACDTTQEHAPGTSAEVPTAKKEVNVYSHRHYDVDKELFAKFTERTGIAVNVIQAGDDELLARLQAEGASSPCDVFITSDAGRLGLARQRGLLRPVVNATLNEAIPANLRDPEGYWFGLTMRARVFAYNKEKVDPAQLKEYSSVTLPKWKGRLLVRSSENVYNQSLVAAMIANKGAEAAAGWCLGVVRNMARDPKGGDTDQLLAVAEGIGDVALANTYYIGKLMASTEPEKQKARDVLGVVFPSMGTQGTHVNISGAGVATHAPHEPEAIALLEYLVSDEAQTLFAEGNKEYPVKRGVAMARELEAFGTFTMDTLNLEALARLNPEAVKVMDKAGWK